MYQYKSFQFLLHDFREGLKVNNYYRFDCKMKGYNSCHSDIFLRHLYGRCVPSFYFDRIRFRHNFAF